MFELIFHVTAGTLPFHLFAYIPFWNYLRLSKKCTMLILFAEQLIFTAAFSLLFRLGFSVSASEFVAVFIYGPIFFYLVRLDIRKVAFLYIFTTDYLMIVKGAAFFLVHALLHLPAIGWQSGTMVLVLFFITMPFMLYYLNQTADIVFGLHTSDIWNTIWMLPLFNSITVLVFTYPVANINVLSLTTRILLMVCMFLVYHFLVRSIRQMQMQTIAEERSRSMELVMQMQASQYALLQSCIQDTRRVRHDLRHHWKALQGYIDSGDLGALASYIRQYGKDFRQNLLISTVRTRPSMPFSPFMRKKLPCLTLIWKSPFPYRIRLSFRNRNSVPFWAIFWKTRLRAAMLSKISKMKTLPAVLSAYVPDSAGNICSS